MLVAGQPVARLVALKHICLLKCPTTFKGNYYVLSVFRATDDVFQQLEDNQVTLSTMKASRYVKAFEAEVRIIKKKCCLVL